MDLHLVAGQIFSKLPQVDHTGTDGIYALGLQLGFRGTEITSQFLFVHINHQSTVVIGPLTVPIKGITGEFSSLYQHIIAAGFLRLDA